VRYVRAKLPPAAAHIARRPLRRADGHWRSSRRAGARGRAAGGELYVWTVDDAARSAARALGVTGVITNDPRLFAQLPSAQVAAE
jgi:glycerophosphoryl diester phosphodiesterase